MCKQSSGSERAFCEIKETHNEEYKKLSTRGVLDTVDAVENCV